MPFHIAGLHMVGRRHFLCLATLTASGTLGAQVRDLNDAINKAGRQRMLSQRMVKSYMALGQGVRPDQTEPVMAESLALFDRQLVELKAFSPSAQIKDIYEQLDGAWSRYKSSLVGAAPSKGGADAVLAAAARVLPLASEGTTLLEVASGKLSGKVVNLAGRQRMLSQRMAAMYLAASWGVQTETCLAAMNAAREEFVRAHGELMRAPETTVSIRGELELVQQQYGFFDAALKAFNNADPSAQSKAKANVFGMSELILKLMDGVTGSYARLA
jgi:nitrate/nitrite-specific signal transduction histidine kinase